MKDIKNFKITKENSIEIDFALVVCLSLTNLYKIVSMCHLSF